MSNETSNTKGTIMYNVINRNTRQSELCSSNWTYVKQFVDGYRDMIDYYVEYTGPNGGKMITYRNW